MTGSSCLSNLLATASVDASANKLWAVAKSWQQETVACAGFAQMFSSGGDFLVVCLIEAMLQLKWLAILEARSAHVETTL